MAGREDTALSGWKEFYESNKKISRLQKKLIAVSALSLAFIIVILSGAHFFLKTRTAHPLIKENTATNLFRVNLIYTPEITTKLRTTKNNKSTLKARFSLEIASHDEKAKVNKKMHLIVNQLKKKLETYAASDLTKTKGIESLRKELLTNINKIIRPIKVNRVFIKDFIIH